MTPVLYSPLDGVDQRRVRESQDDPLIMYLVAPRRSNLSGGELLARAALAAVRCARAFEEDPAWSASFAEWQQTGFRKVCLGARPVEIERVNHLAHAEAGAVLCLPPRRRSTAEPELHRIQTHTGGPLRADASIASRGGSPRMLLLVADALKLTLGKACAQVAHAVLIGRELHQPAAIAAWEDRDCPLEVALVDSEAFDRVKSELVVAAVRDAGLTQIEAGTETVLATGPTGELPHWLEEAARRIL